MSVLIKDMEMPTSCTMCWLNTFCGVWNEEPVKHKGFNERLENCPLTELIRCKDCKHRIMFPSENVYKCLYSDFIAPEHYCGYAERKETS